MARVKRGVTKNARKKRLFKDVKGYRGGRGKRYRMATEARNRGWAYAFKHRKRKKRDFRRLWIVRIGAAAEARGLTYSRLMSGLKKAGVELDRKILADLALADPPAFDSLIGRARAALGA